MSEPKYPRAWGVFQHGEKLRVAFVDRRRAESAAKHARSLNTTIIELIPLPEHEAIVAAAVAAAVERCAGIAKRVADETGGPNRSYLDHFEQERIDTADMIERKIREVPT